ncbi:MAG: hypothetical protein QOE76_3222 [Frankiales bacterium]|nr:hypothetical protein [Frankiales bacterium]
MTTLPSPDRPAPSPVSGPAEPAPAWSVLAAVPILPRAVSPLEVNTAYPDTDHSGASVPPRPGRPRRTSRDRAAGVTRAASAVEAVIGLWLAMSPWFIGSGGSTVLRWNDVAAGGLLAVIAVARLVRPAVPRTPTISFGLGAWTIVAAFVLSFQNGNTGTAPLWNAIGCGAALTVAAAWSTTESERAALRRG